MVHSNLLVALTFCATVLLSCKTRHEASEAKDFSSGENASDFSLRVTSVFDVDERRTKEQCNEPRNMLHFISYIEPINASAYVALSYSICWHFTLEKIKVLDGDKAPSVFGTRDIFTGNFHGAAESLYCRNRKTDRLDFDCIRKNADRIKAAEGYFLQIALPESQTIQALAPYKEVRDIKPLLLDKEKFLSTNFLTYEAEITKKFGTGNPKFRVPVLAMISGMASEYMYSGQLNFDRPRWMRNASDDIATVLYRDIALKQNFAAMKFTSNEILALPELCYRRIENKACLSYQCTKEEHALNKRGHYEEYRLCKPNLGDAVKALTVVLVTPVSVAGYVASRASGDKKTADEVLEINKQLLDDSKRNTIFIRVEDPDDLDKYMRELGIKKRE
jgi:hypothetical protein